MAKANTYELEKGNKVKCLICDFEGTGYTLWYYPTFMNGDAEVEAEFCEKHRDKAKQRLHNLRLPLIAEQKREEAQERKWQENEDSDIKTNLELIKQSGFTVKDLNNGYQIRINGVLDIYPVSKQYHDIKNNHRGSYRRNRMLADFVKRYLI